jgi:GH24 family phage-related lysozyme (muramidase)
MNVEKFKELTREAEGVVEHLYLDTRGNVTVGVGHLVPNVAAAMQLPLEPSCDIAADFARVAAAPKGKPATLYATFCKTKLSADDVDALLEKDTLGFLLELQKHLPQFPAYPFPVQDAVFDMAFNLGIAGFAKYVNLRASLDAKDWAACARRCHRLGISDQRNKRTAAMFTAAVEA